MSSALKFVTWPAIAGLLAALLILERTVFAPADQGRGSAPAATSYAPAVTRASPSVVNIYTSRRIPARRNPLLDELFFRGISPRGTPQERYQDALGSGVIMSAEGHIITNNHVIAGADAIQVALHDGRSARASVIGTDPATDLAVLYVDLPDLIPVTTGDSERVRVGDVVLAIGNPLGFGHSVTQGIVSALGRWGLQPNTYEDYIQTDATIHLGNSGGALIDTRGHLLGINTLIYTTDQGNRGAPTGIGISLAIPVNMALFVMRDLIEYGEVIRGWLGVSVERLATTDASRQALVVVAIGRGSPAEKAGIREGDIITHIDGEAIVDGRRTMHRIAMLRPGDRVAISVQRSQQSLELEAIVGTRRQSNVNPAPIGS